MSTERVMFCDSVNCYNSSIDYHDGFYEVDESVVKMIPDEFDKYNYSKDYHICEYCRHFLACDYDLEIVDDNPVLPKIISIEK